MTLKFEIVKRSLDDPNFSESFGYFYDTRAPNSGDDDYVNSIGFGLNFLVFWWDQAANNVYQLTNWGNSPLIWTKFANNQNILALINSAGWQINTSHSYVQRNSPTFDTPYTPSLTNDTQVIVTVSLTSTLLTPAEVDVQVDTGSGFLIITQESMSGINATFTRSLFFTVPVGASYQVVNFSGISSIVQIMELSQ